MGAGAFAGMFATILTHPMDVVRAKLTIQSQTSKLYKGNTTNYILWIASAWFVTISFTEFIYVCTYLCSDWTRCTSYNVIS